MIFGLCRRRFGAVPFCSVLLPVLAGCGATPKPQFIVAEPQTVLRAAPGPLLMVDSCLQRRVLVGSNHFVISNSQAAGEALEAGVRDHLALRGVQAAPPRIVTVCGVLFDAANPLKTYAEAADGETAQAPQPLRASAAAQSVDGAVMARLLTELQVLAQQPAKDAQPRADAQGLPALRLAPESRAVLSTLAAGTSVPQVLFLALAGNSESSGKQVGQVVGLVILGVAAGVAAGPAAAYGTLSTAQTLAIDVATAAGAQFMSQDGWRLTGALVGAETGELLWSGSVTAASDPLLPASLIGAATNERLLRPLLTRPATEWSYPGRPQPLQ